MKIILCKETKDVEKIAKFLERNLKKVSIEYTECPPELVEFQNKEVIARVDGRPLHASSAYGILKEIRKYLKKEDKLDLLDESKYRKLKKEHKAEHGQEKEEGKSKNKKRKKENAAPEEIEIPARISGDEIILSVPNETFSLEDMKISLDFGHFGDRSSTYEVIKSGEPGSVAARIEGDEVTLTIPNETFSLDSMKLKINYGKFGDQNSTYEVVKKSADQEKQLQSQQGDLKTERSQVMTFTPPEPSVTASTGKDKEKAKKEK